MLSASLIYREECREAVAAIGPYVDEVVAVKSTDAPGAHFEKDCECGCESKAGDLRDFSAARNYAFSLCKGDKIVWIDSDDALEGGAHLRVLSQEHDRVLFPYVFSPVSTFYVPRIVPASERWKYPVHNALERGIEGTLSSRARFVHQRTDFAESTRRGLRLFRHWMVSTAVFQHDARMWGLWARTLIDAGCPIDALPALERALSLEPSREGRAELCLPMAKSRMPESVRRDWAWRAVREAPHWPETWRALSEASEHPERVIYERTARMLPQGEPTVHDIGRAA